MELRDYQSAALEKILWAKNSNLEGNDLCVLPTGAGKSIVIAHLAKRLNEPILILQPSKEILEQNLEKLLQYVDRSEVGVFSASMDEKVVGYYTFATIQSIYKKPELFKHFKLVIIDEAHLVNPKNLTGMFSSFLAQIGNPKVVGFTATPYRMATAYKNFGTQWAQVIATIKLINRMKGFFWQRVLFNINLGELIERGFLCPLEYIDRSVVEQSQLPLNISRSDFDLTKFEKIIGHYDKQVLQALAYAESISKGVLVFCSSVAQATRLATLVSGAAVVSAKTKKKEREQIIKGFKSGEIKSVFNVGVFTVGFDHPALDCIVLLRPTRSIALYYQMLGRGVRIAPGKTHCNIIDLTSTVSNLGKVETIKFVKRDKWELESEVNGEIASWHGSELYNFTFERKPKVAKEDEPYIIN